MEIWKEIPEYPNYKISTQGRIKSSWFSKSRIMKQSIDGRGYKYVNLTNDKPLRIVVHKLMALTFIKLDLYSDGLVIDHIDNNRTNNRITNLQLISQRENTSKDQKNRTSDYIGVFWDRTNRSWRARIRINGDSIALGTYKTEIDAAEAYKKALLELN